MRLWRASQVPGTFRAQLLPPAAIAGSLWAPTAPPLSTSATSSPAVLGWSPFSGRGIAPSEDPAGTGPIHHSGHLNAVLVLCSDEALVGSDTGGAAGADAEELTGLPTNRSRPAWTGGASTCGRASTALHDELALAARDGVLGMTGPETVPAGRALEVEAEIAVLRSISNLLQRGLSTLTSISLDPQHLGSAVRQVGSAFSTRLVQITAIDRSLPNR
jgi:hypothetical protein